MIPLKNNRQCANITDVFGRATSFKLIIAFAWLNKSFKAIIHPLNSVDSTHILVNRRNETFTMSLNDANKSPFLTFVGDSDDITVFSPNKREPIGKIVRRKGVEIAGDEADIFCFAANTKFTLKNLDDDDDSPPSMNIFDSNGTVLGAASVNKWVDTGKFHKITLIEELSFHISDGIPEPIKTMFVVAFTNWGRWSKREINGRGTIRPTKVIFLSIILVLGLSLFVFSAVMLFTKAEC